MTNKQLHNVRSTMMRTTRSMLRLSSSCPTSTKRSTRISTESKRDETLAVQIHYNDECTTSLNWVTWSRTQCDAGGAPGRSATQEVLIMSKREVLVCVWWRRIERRSWRQFQTPARTASAVLRSKTFRIEIQTTIGRTGGVHTSVLAVNEQSL